MRKTKVTCILGTRPGAVKMAPVVFTLRDSGDFDIKICSTGQHRSMLDQVHSDPGGIQEEAPSLGKPVLVMRDTTERPEAVDVGTVRLVGADREKIAHAVSLPPDDPREYEKMAPARNPYGDGRASARILADLRAFFR